MDLTRRGLVAAVPAAVALSGCTLVSGEPEETPPYVVENTTDEPRTVELGVWNVGSVRPVDERPDSFREEFEEAVEDGSPDDSDYEWRETYELRVEPGSAASPVSSSSATGLLYVRAVADHGGEIGHWLEVDESAEAFFVEFSVSRGRSLGFTAGEY
ncbi:hypothetical protein [Halosimplex sp. TS25]|uniref:hypothetical protein n=1 Tax=Halosimplex rarum TaxID=3396619 RepID=UPI0039EA60E1